MAQIIAKPTKNILEVLYRLNVHAEVDPDLLRCALVEVLEDPDTQLRDTLLGSVLTGMIAKGPTHQQIVALLQAAFSIDNFSSNNAIKIELPKGKLLIGAAGSGKKGIKTINISTPSALVAASLGAYIAKPGSSSTSSITGSADFIREVGANIDLNTLEMGGIVQKTGFGFFLIENLIPKFDRLYGGRFYTPHTLSFGLAALLCPVKLDNLLYGLAHPDVELSLKVLREFGIENAMVVSCTHDGIHFLDEMGVYGMTRLIGMRQGMIGKLKCFYPTDILKLPKYAPKNITQGKTKSANIKYAINTLCGQGTAAHEDIICINAGNLLYLSQLAENLQDGYYQAKRAIKNKQVIEKLEEFIDATGGTKGLLHKYINLGR